MRSRPMSKALPPGSLADFAALFRRLDWAQTVRDRQQALLGFLQRGGLLERDAAWALWLLAGERLKRTVPPGIFRKAIEESTGLAPWLVEESYQSVGDLAETASLLVCTQPTALGSLEPMSALASRGLADLIEQDLSALKGLPAEEIVSWMKAAWQQLSAAEIFCLNKMLTGGLRLGLSRQGLVGQLANGFNLAKPRLAERMLFFLSQPPSAQTYRRLVSALEPVDSEHALHGPVPFFLAQSLALEGSAEKQAYDCEKRLGPVSHWAAEWKWDGIRAQLVVDAQGQAQVWSRGEELITDQFPEITQAFSALTFVQGLPLKLDGEILVWDVSQSRPRGFAELQKRLGRRKPSKAIQASHPVVFMAYDLLALAGQDYRDRPFSERREALCAWLKTAGFIQAASAAKDASKARHTKTANQAGNPLRLNISPLVEATTWRQLAVLQSQARDQPAEGLMLKRWDAAYGQGRTKQSPQGELWKWKLAPLTVDAVLIYAQRGHGRRAGLYTDYGFAVWDDRQVPAVLVPFAKAYSGLTDEELKKVDQVVRKTIEDKFGPVRQVRPSLVMELGFEAVMRSARHKSGLSVRFPRILRLRPDKTIEQADRLSSLQAMMS